MNPTESLNPTLNLYKISVAYYFQVDGTVIHENELVEATSIIHHIEVDKTFSDNHDVKEPVCVIHERAILLVIKMKRQNEIVGTVSNRTSMTSQISKVRSQHESGGRKKENLHTHRAPRLTRSK